MEPQDTKPLDLPVSRRRFLEAGTAAGSVARSLAVGGSGFALTRKARAGVSEKPALLGGAPVKADTFPAWPVFDATDENAVAEVVRSGHWGRGGSKKVLAFEQQFAQLMNGKACLATSS